ncbi:MAG: tetratricopeptide repeat protein [Candidatus Acidiferrales bacterium]
MRRNYSPQEELKLAAALDDARNSERAESGYSREIVLLSCIGVLLLMVAATAFVTRMYHKKVHVLADQWFARGEADFHSGNALEAAKDYRNALVYSEANTAFQFHLAQALSAANRPDTDEEAQSYLLNLLAESPGSGEINLELAHISARRKTKAAIQDTQRYYFGAIYGVWQGDPLTLRWDARRELCEYLLAHAMTSQAQPQTIALAQDVPQTDLARQKQAAALLMRAGLPDRALREYRLILTSHRRDPDTLTGAGLSAFQLGQYALAVQTLDALPRPRRSQPEVASALAESREVEALSPFLNGLSQRERAHRAVEAVSRANVLLQNCSQHVAPALPAGSSSTASAQPKAAPQKSTSANASAAATASVTTANPLAQLESVFAQNSRVWRELNFVRHPEQIDAAMSWVFRVENAAAQACGPSRNLSDRALLLLAKSRSGSPA